MATLEFQKIINDFIRDLTLSYPELNTQFENVDYDAYYKYCKDLFPENFFFILYENNELFANDETKYREHVNKAVEINPHHSRSLQAKGLLCLNEGDYDNSIYLLNRANESNRKGVPFFETMLFFCHLGKNDWLSANQTVDRCMRKNDHSRFHAFKAVILAYEGKIEESQHWLKKYQDNRPEIKTLKDYENVVPEINQKVKEILLNGMKKAGLE